MSDASYVLVTGVNGAGKTLMTVAELADTVKGWSADPSKSRLLYVHGIRDLQLEHAPLPVYPIKGKPGDDYRRTTLGQPAEPVAVDWASVEQGSLVVIDEAQKLFPSRAVGSPIPEHVRWFEDGRQLGITVILITQNPTSVDVEIRKRCGLHRHYDKRPFGMVSVREWTGHVQTSMKGGDPTVRVLRARKDVYGLFSSALQHGEKIKQRFPLWAVIPLAGVVLGLVALPVVFGTMGSAMSGKGLASRPASAPGVAGPVPTALPASAAVAVLAASAPAPVASAPLGCISMGPRCLCVDQAGRSVLVDVKVCRESAGGYTALMPYPVRPDPPSSSASGVALAAPGAAAAAASSVNLLAGLR